MKKKTYSFNEEYIIKYNIKEKNGLWRIGEEEEISVAILNPKQEKNSHQRAGESFLNKKKSLGYNDKDIKIICITYC